MRDRWRMAACRLCLQRGKRLNNGIDFFIAVRGIDAAAQQRGRVWRGRRQNEVYIHAMGDQFAPDFQPFLFLANDDGHDRANVRSQAIPQLFQALIQPMRVVPQFLPQRGLRGDGFQRRAHGGDA